MFGDKQMKTRGHAMLALLASAALVAALGACKDEPLRPPQDEEQKQWPQMILPV